MKKAFSNNRRKAHQKGFTIIELMIATLIFSAVLVLMLASFLQIGRIYYKGVSVASTNEATRTVVDDVTSDMRLTQETTNVKTESNSTANRTNQYFCVGSHRYSYTLSSVDHQVKPPDINTPNAANPNGIVLDTVSNGCPDPSQPGGGGNDTRQLLGANMQLNYLKFNCNSLSSVGACSLSVRVVFYGVDDTVLTPSATDPNAACNGNLLSTQFCYVAFFSSNAITNF